MLHRLDPMEEPMHSTLAGLGLTLPVLAAPMAGGPRTPAPGGGARPAGGRRLLGRGPKPPRGPARPGTLTPDRLPPEIPLTQLLGEVGAVTPLPLIGAGGLGTPDDVAAAVGAGAVATAVGTVLLRSEEAGTSAPFRAALGDHSRRPTVVTRAFTGRPARGLANIFTDRYSALAPTGYPALHHLTSPIRKAATAAGDPERINLWAGTGYRHAVPEPTGSILADL